MSKKGEPVEERLGPWALGKFSTRLKVGIVGLPNVGKSTLYNTLTKCSIPAENFPFCTIDPNETRVHVPDDRFDWLVDKFKPKSEVQPWLEIVDIAGLVKGASQVSIPSLRTVERFRRPAGEHPHICHSLHHRSEELQLHGVGWGREQ